MAVTDNDVRKNFAAMFATAVTILGKVTKVDEQSRTCTIDDDGALMYGVRLQPITSGDSGIINFPKIGCFALIVKIEDGSDYMVLAMSEVDKSVIKIGDSSIEITGNEVKINDGTVGATKTDELAKKLNNLENQVNNILTTIKGISITLAPSGTFVFAPLFASINNLTPTQQADIEDTKIKH